VEETFHGPWSVVVYSNTSKPGGGALHRFTITGSDASDGRYPAAPGSAAVIVSGQAWTIAMEWRGTFPHPDQTPLNWHPTKFTPEASYTPQDGLVVFLHGDDKKFAATQPTQLVLKCRSRNPAHQPLPGGPISHNFTVSEEAMGRYRAAHPLGPDHG
jgi:hypothetical protein